MARQKRIELYLDAENLWRFRVKAGNNRVVGASEQGFTRRDYAVKRAHDDFPGLPIIEAAAELGTPTP